MVLPLFILLLSGIIDFGRYVYVRGTLDTDVIRAARAITLASNQKSDCVALNDVLSRGNGIIDLPDPNSLVGDLAPTAGGAANLEPSVPPAGTGYIYVYPAVSTAIPQLPANCNAPAASSGRPSGPVVVQTTYSFVPWTPLIAKSPGTIIIFATSTQTTEY